MKMKKELIKETNELMQNALKEDAQMQLVEIVRDIRAVRKEQARLEEKLADLRKKYTDVVDKYENEIKALEDI